CGTAPRRPAAALRPALPVSHPHWSVITDYGAPSGEVYLGPVPSPVLRFRGLAALDEIDALIEALMRLYAELEPALTRWHAAQAPPLPVRARADSPGPAEGLPASDDAGACPRPPSAGPGDASPAGEPLPPAGDAPGLPAAMVPGETPGRGLVTRTETAAGSPSPASGEGSRSLP